MSIASVRQNILLLAEAFDAWRVIPRLMLLAYGYLVFNLYIWYKNIPTYVQEKCDSEIVNLLLAKGMAYPDIKQFACTVVDVVGGPTTAQSTFVTTIIGLSTGIFGLYTTTGRKWDGYEPNFTGKNLQNMQVNYTPTQNTAQAVVPVHHADGSVTLEPAVTEAPKTSIQIFANQQPAGTVPAPETAVTAPDVTIDEPEGDDPSPNSPTP